MNAQNPYPLDYPGAPAPRKTKGKRSAFVLAFIAAVAFSCLGGVGIGVVFASPEASSSTATDDQPVQPVDESASVGTAPAKTQAPTFEDGVWTVGTDIPAGRYRTTEAVGSRCYWQISKTGGDSVMDIINNDLPGGGRPQVTLKKGQDFKTSDCGKWRKV